MQLEPIADALRCITFDTPRSPNLATTRDALSRGRLPLGIPLLKESFLSHRGRYTLVKWDGPSLKGLATVRMRSGPRAWEVARLYVPTQDEVRVGMARFGARGLEGDSGGSTFSEVESEVLQLLEGLALYAGSLGAERVFLRTPCGSPLVRIARHSGFIPYFDETLLEGSGADGDHRRPSGVRLRPWLPHEEYALFQLYSASTPCTVRSGLGMTFDQWKHSRERRVGRGREQVCEKDGKLRAWVRSDPSGFSLPGRTGLGRPAQIELVVHPDEVDLLSGLVQEAAAANGFQTWLVPEYHEILRKLLIHRGFREVAHYTMLIKTVAARVKSPSVTAVEARVW